MADAFSQYDDFDALGLGRLVTRRDVHPRELVDTAIDRIERLNGKLNVVTVRAYESARAEALRPLTGAPFDGVPFLAKDLSTSWKGLPSTNSCQYMADYVSRANSEVVRRTRLAGFITLRRATSRRLFGRRRGGRRSAGGRSLNDSHGSRGWKKPCMSVL